MPELKPFDERAFYKTIDPALNAILAPQTLRIWRCKGRGPKYVKIGSRVFYRGGDLNQFIESRLVEPPAA